MDDHTGPDIEPICPTCKRVSWVGWCDYCEVRVKINCTVCRAEVLKCAHGNSRLRHTTEKHTSEKHTSRINVRIAAALRFASIAADPANATNDEPYTFIGEVWSNRSDALAPLLVASMTGADLELRILREAAAYVLGLRSSFVIGSLSKAALKHAPGFPIDSAIHRDRRWPGVLAASLRFRPLLSTDPALSRLAIELFTLVQERVGISRTLAAPTKSSTVQS